ncbi:MAG TPA: alpha/beta hydrolase [Mycobacteriales bacterium]
MTETPDVTGGSAGAGRALPDDLPELPGVTHAFVPLQTGLRMHVAQAGEPHDPAVVLLHGFPQHWWEWRKVISPLAERYRVIAPDLRGAGWTDAPADGYTADQVLADVLALLDALGLRQVGLVAHDFSVFAGFRLCYEYPERVAAFLCLGPHPYLRVKPHMLAGIPSLWFQPVVAAPRLGPWALRTDRLARHLLTGFTATPDSMSEEDVAVFTRRLHAPGHPEAGSALYRNLILPEMSRFLASRAYRGRRLTVPTVSLVGAADAGVRPGMLDVHGDQADDLAGHLIDGAGHFIADDRPDAVVAHALELLAGVL